MAKIIIIRLSIAVDVKLRIEQTGFRPSRGCIDQIQTQDQHTPQIRRKHGA